MNFLTVGDLAQTFQNRRHNVQIKSELARLAQELASGQKSVLSTDLAGDYAPIVGMERDLKANSAYALATAEAEMFASAQQSVLATIQDISTDLGSSLVSAGISESALIIQTTAADSKSKFSAVLASLNTAVAGRYAFSGAATDSRSLSDMDTIFQSLKTAVAAETTAAGIEAVVDSWFNDVGGGFETVAYSGSSTAMSNFRLSDAESASMTITAADPNIRSVLKGFALAALVGDGALAGNISEQAALVSIAGEKVLAADYALAKVQAEIGASQAQIEISAARNSSEKVALEIARTEITGIDPYETATELETVQLQLESLYTLTVRLSRLSFAEYLR